MFKTSIFVLLLAAAAFAADVAGKWTGQVPARGGETREATFMFKMDGDKLTGTMSGPQGDRPISDVKVTGDTITFAVEGQRGKQVYTGTLAGDEIKFKREGGQGQAREFTVKRAK
jgi:hypothetical protein